MKQDHENGRSEMEALCLQAASGDRPAFRRLVELTHKTTYRLAYRILGLREEADDVVQETFVRAWQNLGSLRDPGAVEAWIYRVARNVAYDRLRKRGRQKTESLDQTVGDGLSPLVELVASDDPTPETQIMSAEVVSAVRQAMGKLKEKHRLILMLREVDAMSYEEIASALGCAVGTVESRLFRARRALARRLKAMALQMGKEI